MRNPYNKRKISLIMVLSVIVILAIQFSDRYGPVKKSRLERAYSTSSPKASFESRKERAEYFFRMLRDPATNKIPAAIRQKELKFAKTLSEKSSSLSKQPTSLEWKEAGPNDVGGRTRALAIDIKNPNTILAGGVSGGMWKSTDNGATWYIKSSTTQVLSVTSIAQDRRNGFTNNWYYVSGEYPISSASDLAYTAYFTGDGVYKSTDNGESWSILPGTISKDFTSWTSPFDCCLRVIVTAKGNIFIATSGYGIYRSTDGGNTFTNILGAKNEHIYSDIIETSNGVLVATISSPFQDHTSKKEPGVYKSDNEGETWAKITPNTFPTSHKRSTIAAAPSNPNIIYILTDVGVLKNNKDDVRFHKINLQDGSSEDRSANMPDFGHDFHDYIITQYCYNLTLAVKPDDENFVIIGATSLFRSTDGFASKPNNEKLNWIGGYNLTRFFYPNLHPDIHSFAFDPTDPKKMWWGHDGGLSYTSDITNTNYQEVFPWENKNNGYNVTQFYGVSISGQANDNRIMGGTQDNGTPFFACDGNLISKSTDVSTGDGGYSYFGKDFAFSSWQNGHLKRCRYDNSGNSDLNTWSMIYPANAQNQLFVTPYAVDPSNEEVIYYSAGNFIWRNTQISSIPDGQQSTMQGWEEMSAVNLQDGFIVTALTVSVNNPSSTLYYALCSYQSQPKIYKLPNAQTANSGLVEISIPQSVQGAYVSSIAVNPDDANEIMVVMSNYNIVGLYYSSDGGQTYSAVEGNLEGDKDNPGPSIRGATILPTDNGKVYLLATSIGVFSTTNLNKENTVWTQESPNEIGNAVVNYITSRKSDGRIAAGTHGRGIFISPGKGTSSMALASVNVKNLKIEAKPGGTGSAGFILENKGGADLSYNITAAAQLNKNHEVINGNNQEERKGNNEGVKGATAGIKKPVMKAAGSIVLDDKARLPKKAQVNKKHGSDIIILDDGNDSPDVFFGYGSQLGFSFANEFDLTAFDYNLDGIEVFLRTEYSDVHAAGYAVRNDKQEVIYSGYKTLPLSQNGQWFTIPLDTVISFKKGETFYLEVDAQSVSYYSAGFDLNALVKNKSYYVPYGATTLENINTVQGAENGAFLLRAAGKITGTGGTVKLNVEPSSGILGPGASKTITVTANAENAAEGIYQATVTILSNGGNISIPVQITVSNTIIAVEEQKNIPDKYALFQNYPNPFNPETIIRFSIPEAGNVVLKVYDSGGREVSTLLNNFEKAGEHKVIFNAMKLSSGVYYYSLRTDKYTEARKMVFVK